MENKNTYYVYAHLKKTDGKCFYIGKGTRDRYKNSIGRNTHWWNTVNKYGFTPVILINNITEQKAFELESIICQQIGYKNLTNIRTEEGWGGYSMSNETKQKISKSLKGKTTNPYKGITGENHFNYGKSHSIKTRQRISESLKGKKHTTQTKNKISNSLKGKTFSKEHIRNKSKIVIQYDLKGNFIDEYYLCDIKNKIKGDISACARGKQKTAGGFIWKYKK